MRQTKEEIAGDALPAVLVMLEKMDYMLTGTCIVTVLRSLGKRYSTLMLYAEPVNEEQPKLAIYVSGPWWDGEGKDCYVEYGTFELNTQYLIVEEDSLWRGQLYWSWREPGCYMREPITRESIKEDSVHWVKRVMSSN